MPFFSVVVPVHNKAQHIARSIGSALRQSFDDFELIIVDDASTDNSLSEIQQFSDPRIRIFHRHIPGPGGYAARNRAIEEARGEWIAFLDADDEWMPHHLQRMHALSSEFEGVKVLGCGYRVVAPVEEMKGSGLDAYSTERGWKGCHYLTFDEFLEAECQSMRPIHTSASCLQKEILQGAGGFPAGRAKRGGDVDTWLRCIEKAGGLARGDYIGAVYYRDSSNMCTRTEPFLAEVERESVKSLLPYYDGKTAKLLKRFANCRTLSAWRQNANLPRVRNFSLIKNLYLMTDPVRNLAWTAISLMPRGFLIGLRRAKATTRNKVIPALKRSSFAETVRYCYAYYLRMAAQPKPKGQIQDTEISILSDGDNPTFFGYHDKTPFSADGGRILAMSVAASDTDPRTEGTPMKLGYFPRVGAGDFESAFTSFAETTTWCFQQGCMLQWDPVNANTCVYFNTLVDGGYGAILFDVDKGETIRQYRNPIYAIDPTGRYAVTLNFARLGRLRPGYGYGLLPDSTRQRDASDNDGLFLLDLETDERRLLVSLAELAAGAGDVNAQHYVNHATFSPDGERILFFHLWAQEGDRDRGLRVCQVDLNTFQWSEIEAERVVSHYCWRDADVFLATTRDKSGAWHYTLYDLRTNERLDLNLPLERDGHPMFHPNDKDVIVTDTYPDRRRDQHLCVIDLPSKSTIEIGTLYSAHRYRGQVRCDLHPRWDREGSFVAVDSTAFGKRALLLVRTARLESAFSIG